MATGRSFHTAVLLGSGRVLVSGGQASGITATAELFDPLSHSWIAAPNMANARYAHAATLLPNGELLVIGGSPDSGFLTQAERFADPLHIAPPILPNADATVRYTAVIAIEGGI